MNNLKISLVIPVKNEAESIGQLLETIFSQTKLPDEVVITDGGSTDSTTAIVQNYIDRGLPIKLIKTPGAFPGRGRNLAIQQVSNDLIALTDAGVTLDKFWLEKLTAPFVRDPDCQISYGAFVPVTDNIFQKCVALVFVPFQAVASAGLSDGLVPFVASLAFKKQLWFDVGGFREDLRSHEDTVFFNDLTKLKPKFCCAPGAVVYWNQRRHFRDVFQLSYNNGKYSFLAGVQTEAVAFRLIFYLGLLVLLATFYRLSSLFWVTLVSAILFRAFHKARKAPVLAREIFGHISGWLYFYSILLLEDLGLSLGFLAGVFGWFVKQALIIFINDRH